VTSAEGLAFCWIELFAIGAHYCSDACCGSASGSGCTAAWPLGPPKKAAAGAAVAANAITGPKGQSLASLACGWEGQRQLWCRTCSSIRKNKLLASLFVVCVAGCAGRRMQLLCR
jgi:hypothetical protein